jgi:WD40 repeat protein
MIHKKLSKNCECDQCLLIKNLPKHPEKLENISDYSKILNSNRFGILLKNKILKLNKMYVEGHFGSVLCGAVTRDDKYIITGSSDTKIRIWNLGKLRQKSILEGHACQVNCLAVTSNNFFLSGSSDKTLKLWDLKTKSLIHNFEGHNSPIICVCITEDDEYAISGSQNRSIRIWNLKTKSFHSAIFGYRSLPTSISVINSSVLISASEDMTLRLWSLPGIELQVEIKCNSYISCTTGSSKFIICACSDNLIKVFDFQSKSQIGTLKGHLSIITGIKLICNDDYLASSSADHRIIIWSTATMDFEKELLGHKETICFLGATNDQKFLFSGSTDKTLKIWDLTTRQMSSELPGHLEYLECVCITKDAKYALTGSGLSSYDSTIRLWNLQTKQQEYIFEGNTACVTAVGISDTNLHVASFSHENTIRIWNFITKNCQGSFFHSFNKNIPITMIFTKCDKYLIVSDYFCIKVLNTEDVTLFYTFGLNTRLTDVVLIENDKLLIIISTRGNRVICKFKDLINDLNALKKLSPCPQVPSLFKEHFSKSSQKFHIILLNKRKIRLK